jgi:HEAT repeat protein
LNDKLEFVRREAVSALGETRSRSAVQPLVEMLATEKEVSVRAAAIVALGQIRDESAVPALAQVLSGVSPNKKSKQREDDFVMRSAARGLGAIGSRAGVEPLVAALTNETNSIDVRRAAAEALGLIGDSSATSALEAAVASKDPYLSEAAREALRRLRLAKK